MGLLRDYIWLWVIIVVIFVSFLIILVFLLINKCISRGGKHRISQLHKDQSAFHVESNKYHERNPEVTIPPLPPRSQFLTGQAQSYENLAEGSDQFNIPDYEQDRAHIPDYEQDQAHIPDYEENFPEYEQNMVEPPDYVSVEDEVKDLPPPPPPYEDPDADNSSTEDYDDIGEDDNQGEEDYDDVG